MENKEQIRGLNQEEREELKRLLNRFIDSYCEKSQVQTDEEWLQKQLMAELPKLGVDAAAAYSRETGMAIRAYDEALASLAQAHSHGNTMAEWFFRYTRQSCRGMSDVEYATGILAFHTSLEEFTGISAGNRGEAFQSVQADGDKELSDTEVRKLAKKAGEQVELAGYQSVVRFTEYISTVSDGPGQENAAVVRALETGEVAGLKTAVAGALTTAAEKNVIHVISEETRDALIPVNLYANMAGMAIEDTITSMQLSKRKISVEEAVNQKAANAAVAITGAIIRTVGTGFGDILGRIPIAGPIIQNVCIEVTSAVEKKASPKVREVVMKANGPVAVCAKKKVARITDGMNKVKEKTVEFIHLIRNKVASLIHS